MKIDVITDFNVCGMGAGSGGGGGGAQGAPKNGIPALAGH